MAITIITGVPGTGKTAFVVSLLEEEAKRGRVIFVDNIPGLQIPHFRAGKITEWQKGTWLHIDRYKRTAPAEVMSRQARNDEDGDEDSGNENWEPNPDVLYTEGGEAKLRVRDSIGQVVGVTDYQSHKGALLVIDECQRHFRPRPSGSAVPDHVAAFEVHRHQGLDIWLITQRVGLIDSNVRGLCGRHIALRSTALGRYKYEWPEVGDVDSKTSRDTAARTRYKLPKHVFGLYKSAEVHTKHGHSLPFMAKALFVIIPAFIFLLYLSYNVIDSKLHPKPKSEEPAQTQPQPSQHREQKPGQIQNAKMETSPPRFETLAAIEPRHPFEDQEISIAGRAQLATRDIYRFKLADKGGQYLFSVSSSELLQAGYIVVPITNCSVRLIYKSFEFMAFCAPQPVQPQPLHQPPQPVQMPPHPTKLQQALLQ